MATYDFTNLETVRGLLTQLPEATFGFPTFLVAVTDGPAEVVRLMLLRNIEKGAQFTPVELGEALTKAMIAGREETAAVLLRAGAGRAPTPAGTVSCGNDVVTYIKSFGLEERDFPKFMYWLVDYHSIDLETAVSVIYAATRNPKVPRPDQVTNGF